MSGSINTRPCGSPGAVGQPSFLGRFAIRACSPGFVACSIGLPLLTLQGRSRLLTGEPTLHTRTACMVAEALTDARFRISKQPPPAGVSGESGLWLIECDGAAVAAPKPGAYAA